MAKFGWKLVGPSTQLEVFKNNLCIDVESERTIADLDQAILNKFSIVGRMIILQIT